MPPADLSRIYFGYLLLIVQLFIKLKGKIGQRLTSRAPGYARSFSRGRGVAASGEFRQAAGPVAADLKGRAGRLVRGRQSAHQRRSAAAGSQLRQAAEPVASTIAPAGPRFREWRIDRSPLTRMILTDEEAVRAAYRLY